MKIAIVGLGKMGYQIVEKLLNDNFEVVAMDRTQESVAAAAKIGAIAAYSREDVITKFIGAEIIIWLMIPANAIDDEIIAWQSILPSGSTLIDGGNSDFRLTQKRAQLLLTKNIKFVDVGTSGGILGMENGFSMMVGGSEASYDKLLPIFDTLAKPSGSFNYFGPNGSGHFVKMVHNAIEYGVMESLAEGYHILREGPYKEIDLAKVAEVWQHGSIIESSLNNLALEIFKENPNLNGFDGVVAESGEARWTLEAAKELDIKMPATKASFDVRIASENGEISFATKLLAALRNKFGGHSKNPQ